MRRKKIPGLQAVPEEYLMVIGTLRSKTRWRSEDRRRFAKDTVGDHILRCLVRTPLFPLSDYEQGLLRKVIFLTHIPNELWVGQDKDWVGELEKAHKALWGIWAGEVNQMALLAKTIELMDDIEWYYGKITYWMKTNGYKDEYLPSDKKITELLDIGVLAQKNLQKWAARFDHMAVAVQMLKGVNKKAVEWWYEVPNERIPPDLIRRMAEIELEVAS